MVTRRHDRADGRPRIYITRASDGARWSLAPNAVPMAAPGLGAAFEAALAAIGARDAVVIYGDPFQCQS